MHYPEWALDIWKFGGVAGAAYLSWGWKSLPWVLIGFGVLAFAAGIIQDYRERQVRQKMSLGRAASIVENLAERHG